MLRVSPFANSVAEIEMRKTGHYRRAFWFEEHNEGASLTEKVATALDEWDGEATFSLSDELECIIARRIDRNGRIFLSLIAVQEGATAAVIPALERAAQLDAEEANAPDGMEFVQAQVLCLLDGDHLMWTTHNSAVRESSVARYLSALLLAFHPDDDPARFHLRAELDTEQLRRALQDGVKEIDLGVGAFRSTLEEMLGFDGEQGGVLSHFASFFTADRTAEEMDAAAKVDMKVALRPGRDWNNEDVLRYPTFCRRGQEFFVFS
ncbi:hypothetical protein GTF97_21800, partial [Roseobacter sp. HKCCD8767]|uniref:hypothetical protein n=1 Tax=unclassified Roseobacter TaxID=196798 RepID=UPI00149181C3